MKLYAALGLPDGAPIQDVKQQYRKLALQHHPDRDRGDPVQFQAITAAYAVLSDEHKKRQYDALGDDDPEISQLLGGNRCSRFPHAVSTTVGGQEAVFIPGFGTFLANGDRAPQEGGTHPYADGPKYTAAELEKIEAHRPRPEEQRSPRLAQSPAKREPRRPPRYGQERVVSGAKAMFLPGFGTFLANGERAGDLAGQTPRSGQPSPQSATSSPMANAEERRFSPRTRPDSGKWARPREAPKRRESAQAGVRRSSRTSEEGMSWGKPSYADAASLPSPSDHCASPLADQQPASSSRLEPPSASQETVFLPGFGTFTKSGERTPEPNDSLWRPEADKVPGLLLPSTTTVRTDTSPELTSPTFVPSVSSLPPLSGAPASPLETVPDAAWDDGRQTELFETELGSITALHAYRMENRQARAAIAAKLRHPSEERRLRAIRELDRQGEVWLLDAVAECPDTVPALLGCLLDDSSLLLKAAAGDLLQRLTRDHGFRLLSETSIVAELSIFIDRIAERVDGSHILEQALNWMSQLVRLAPGAKQYHQRHGTAQVLRLLRFPAPTPSSPGHATSPPSDRADPHQWVFSEGFSGGFSQAQTPSPAVHRGRLSSFSSSELASMGLEVLLNGCSGSSGLAFSPGARPSPPSGAEDAWDAHSPVALAALRVLRHLIARNTEAYQLAVPCIPALVQRLDLLCRQPLEGPGEELVDAVGDVLTDMATSAFHPVRYLLPVLSNVYSILHGTGCRQGPYIAACLLHLVWSTYEGTPRHLRPPKLVVRMAMVGKVLDLIQQPPADPPKYYLWAVSLLVCWSELGEVRPTRRYCDAVAAALRRGDVAAQAPLKALGLVQLMAAAAHKDRQYAAELAPNLHVIATALSELLASPTQVEEEAVARAALDAVVALFAAPEFHAVLRGSGVLVRRRLPCQPLRSSDPGLTTPAAPQAAG